MSNPVPKNNSSCDHRCSSEILPMLYEIAITSRESKDLHLLMDSIVNLLVRYVSGVKRILLAMYNRHTETITIESAYGISADEQKRGVYRRGEGILGRVIEEGKPVIIPDLSRSQDFLNRTGAWKEEERRGLSFLCVPIVMGQESLGALSMDRTIQDESLLEDDLKVLMIIATLVAQAFALYRAQVEEQALLKEENRRLHQELEEKYRKTNIIGKSKAMRSLFGMMERIYDKNTPVLILGESGTGKELIAHAIHYNSPRREKPFIKFNCAAIPESLAESELFGHERGAFTGASEQRLGLFEKAHGGTLFLDEIGELSLSIQAKLLRVLQFQEFQRLGGHRTISVDVRLIAATHRDLDQMVKEGRFREDLWYRLNVFPLLVPPLRERGSDILLLADYFVEKYSQQHNSAVRRISTPAIDALMAYHWPGNVRELENVIERAVILSDDGVIHAYHLPPSLQTPDTSRTHYQGLLAQRLSQVEREMIVDALKAHQGNMLAAARELGITERIITRRVKDYGIDYRLFRPKK
ncbi:MAG TPA: sigma 54-interacting transcriptional regulator [Termitinemataceae bacterium]|nr:sigma 54-interacting transcriptional regulator [Termitinemataceae bacterium]HOM22866.1 sigma 54-interacting transcriptional regulator [Termitinemataceae bacterium]HPP99807.1 sigma 54-interacting transcriptional regulator [Termitinemataceae bacterium]